MLVKKLCLSNSEIKFAENEYGKPFLENNSKFHFNISHTKNALAVAISDKEIGVDVERIGTTDLNIAKRFFTTYEQEYIMTAIDKAKAFYEIWTKKEAYIKYKGKGLSIPLLSFNVLDNLVSKMIYTWVWNGYVISVCGENMDTKVQLYHYKG